MLLFELDLKKKSKGSMLATHLLIYLICLFKNNCKLVRVSQTFICCPGLTAESEAFKIRKKNNTLSKTADIDNIINMYKIVQYTFTNTYSRNISHASYLPSILHK